jgi:hypothetical protein
MFLIILRRSKSQASTRQALYPPFAQSTEEALGKEDAEDTPYRARAFSSTIRVGRG